MIESSSLTFLIIVIIIALAFEFANGFNDAANAIATVVSTRVMSPLSAVIMAAVFNFVGAITGTAVAKAVAKGVVDPDGITQVVVAGGVAAAALWVFVASRFGMPVSGSHSLIAGVAGSGVAHSGINVLQGAGLTRIVEGLVFSPILGFLLAYLVMLIIYWSLRRVSPAKITLIFSKAQMFTAGWMAFSHGSNDAQKTMGIITLALFTFGSIDVLDVPLWVVLVSGLVMGAGTYFGGFKVIRTLGVRIVTMRPIHGFAASMAAGSVIEVASNIGLPVSTTHTISGSIIGVGATRRLSAVRWGVTRSILMAWVVTYPFCFVVGWSIAKALMLAD